MKTTARRNRNSFSSKVRSVFFIYTEASAAVFLLVVAGVELFASFAVPETFFQSFFRGAATVFALFGLLSALWVMHQAREHGIISNRKFWSKA